MSSACHAPSTVLNNITRNVHHTPVAEGFISLLHRCGCSGRKLLFRGHIPGCVSPGLWLPSTWLRGSFTSLSTRGFHGYPAQPESHPHLSVATPSLPPDIAEPTGHPDGVFPLPTPPPTACPGLGLVPILQPPEGPSVKASPGVCSAAAAPRSLIPLITSRFLWTQQMLRKR